MECSRSSVYLVVAVLCMFGTVWSLECKQCSNVQIHSDSSSIASKIGLKDINSNPDCKAGTKYETVKCPESLEALYMCDFVDGNATFDFEFGSIKVGVQSRGCAAVDLRQNFACRQDSDVARKVIHDVLSEVTEPATEVDSQICYCASDMCSAFPCSGYIIRNICLPKWATFLLGIVFLVITILLLSCCCCCCCRCCRNKRYVFVQQPAEVSYNRMV